MKLSCCTWALDEGRGPFRFWRKFRNSYWPEPKTLSSIAELGFKTIDIRPSMLQTQDTQSLLKSLKLDVTCVALSHEAPHGATLDSADPERVDPLIKHTNKGMDHASKLGAAYSYVIPGQDSDDKALSCFGDRCAELAERGQERGVKVCIEHFPGRALPTVKATLHFIKEVNHPNLYLLFDIGHAQMSKEDPAQVLPMAGDRLGYVHLDDNDGVGDLHLALADGVQTQESLASLFQTLEDVAYTGPLSLELNKSLPDPLDALKRSKRIVEQFIESE